MRRVVLALFLLGALIASSMLPAGAQTPAADAIAALERAVAQLRADVDAMMAQTAATNARLDTVAATVAALTQPTATVIPTIEPTAEPTATATPLPTATATQEPATSTATTAPSPTSVPTSTPTVTPTPTPQPTPSPSPSSTPAPGVVVVSPGQSINAGIAAAPAGGTVRVLAGIYREYVVVTKPLRLEAFPEGGSTVIDAECTRNIGIGVTASDVTIYGFKVQNARISTIRVNGDFVGGATAHRVTVQNNILHNFNCSGGPDENRAGVSFWQSGSGMRVLGNAINGNPSLADTAQARRSGNGVWFKSNSANPSGGGHLISGNVIRHVYDGIGGETEDDPRGGFDRNGTIENNTIEDCHDDGISVEGGTMNMVVRNNTIRYCGIGIANAPNLTSTAAAPITFEANVIRLSRPGNYGNEQCFKVGNSPLGYARFIGNTCELLNAAPQASTGWGQTNAGLGIIYSRNNRILVTRYVIEAVFANGSTFDFDCLYSNDPTGRFVETPQGKFSSLAAWRAATGQEQNGTACTP
jgi:parallel beta-helix repeat protein